MDKSQVFSNYNMAQLNKAEAYAYGEMLYLRKIMELTDDQWDQLCFMFIEAFWEGYRTSESHHLSDLRHPYVPNPKDFSSESIYLEALNAWRKFNR